MNFIKIGVLFYLFAFSFQSANLEASELNMNVVNNEDRIGIQQQNEMNLADCMKVTVSSNSSKLKKGKPFLVTIIVENQTDKRISLDYNPIVTIQKKGSSGIDLEIMGNQFYSIVYFDDGSEFMTKDFIEPNGKLEFVVDITKLKWGHSIQANIPTANIFNILPKREYDLLINFRTTYSENGKQDIKHFESNTLNVSNE